MINPSLLTPFEKRVIEEVLVGHEEWKQLLVSKLEALRVVSRRSTGVGFYTNFAEPIPIDSVAIPETALAHPVERKASHPALIAGALFLVWLRPNGIKFLEGVTAAGQFPEDDEFTFE